MKIFALAMLAGFGLTTACKTRDYNVGSQSDLRKLIATKTPTLNLTHDVAVEIEMSLSPNVMQFITTKDGTVGPLLKPGEKFPSWFVEFAKSKFPSVAVEKVAWDDLSYKDKLRLMRDLLPAHRQDFEESRRYHGLAVRKSVKATFSAPTELFGKKYAAGTHDVDVSGVLLDRVEAASHTSLNEFTDLELHFRGRHSAGTMSKGVWDLQKAMVIPQANQHVNMVDAIPFSEFQKDPDDMSCRTAEAYRRVNLLAEAKGIIEDNALVVDSVSGDYIYFGSLKSERLTSLLKFLRQVPSKKAFKVGTDFKMSWVGYRGSDLYGEGLWGYEFRAISDNADVESTRYMLDAVHSRFLRNDLGISDAEWTAWKKTFDGSPLAAKCQFVASSWYNNETDIGPSEIAKITDPEWRDALTQAATQLAAAAKFNESVRLFSHDWSHDGVFYKDAALLKQIRAEQIFALKSLMRVNPKNTAATHDIGKGFLRRSGIYQALLKNYDLAPK